MLQMTEIKWTKIHPEDTYSSSQCFDEQGNKWYMTADQDVIIVTLTDGRNGMGWTTREAWENAQKK